MNPTPAPAASGVPTPKGSLPDEDEDSPNPIPVHERPGSKEVQDLDVDDIPLFMKDLPGKENKALEGLQALLYDDPPEVVAENFKNQGNEAFKRGKTYFKDAIAFYDQGLEQKCSDKKLNATLLSNKAAVNLVLENYGHVISDCKSAIAFDPTNLKAYYRAAKASLALQKFSDAIRFAEEGVEKAKTEAEQKDLRDIITNAKEKQEKQMALEAKRKAEQESSTHIERKLLELAFKRGYKVGPMLYHPPEAQDHSLKYDETTSTLLWPVLFLYPEFNQSDFIQAFRENDTFESHLAEMFPPTASALPWDSTGAYRSDTVEIYFLANSTSPYKGFGTDANTEQKKKRWLKIAKHVTLQKALSHVEHIIPGFPVFHILVPGKFRNRFLKDPE